MKHSTQKKRGQGLNLGFQQCLCYRYINISHSGFDQCYMVQESLGRGRGCANFPEAISLLVFEVSQNWLETAPVSSTAQAAESTFRTGFSKSLIFLSNYQTAFHDFIPKMRKNNDGRLASRCSPCKALKGMVMPEFMVSLAQLRQRWPELLESKQGPASESAILSS